MLHGAHCSIPLRRANHGPRLIDLGRTMAHCWFKFHRFGPSLNQDWLAVEQMSAIPENMNQWLIAMSLLDYRVRRWPNIKPASDECLLFPGLHTTRDVDPNIGFMWGVFPTTSVKDFCAMASWLHNRHHCFHTLNRHSVVPLALLMLWKAKKK